MTTCYALFETAIGRCGIAWGEAGIVAVQLPEADDRRTSARLLSRHAGAQLGLPPPAVQRAMGGVTALLRGEPLGLLDVELDMQGVPLFNQRVYAAARAIAPGHTLTYGEVAAGLGEPGAARAVGRALGLNPFAPIVPCHRVLAAGGGFGGFSARGGVVTKLRMLAIEGARVNHTPDLFDTHPA
jgi:methylated-DNA-[protein]-cysteine S-methyltransferase